MSFSAALPPQSNIQSTEERVYIHKKVLKSDELILSDLDYLFLTEPNTLDYIDTQEEREINEFIENYRLAPFMEEVEVQVRKYFPHSVIDKELYTDPEEGGTKLYLTILTPDMSRKEILKNNLKLFRDWQLVRNRAFNTYINITARAV